MFKIGSELRSNRSCNVTATVFKIGSELRSNRSCNVTATVFKINMFRSELRIGFLNMLEVMRRSDWSFSCQGELIAFRHGSDTTIMVEIWCYLFNNK